MCQKLRCVSRRISAAGPETYILMERTDVVKGAQMDTLVVETVARLSRLAGQLGRLLQIGLPETEIAIGEEMRHLFIYLLIPPLVAVSQQNAVIHSTTKECLRSRMV